MAGSSILFVRSIILLLFTGHCTGRPFPKGMLRDAKQNPELASAIWGRMLHICASRSALLCKELRF